MSGILAWFMSHEVVLAALVIAVIDFIISINPNVASNSIIHWILLQAQSLVNAISPPKA